MARRRGAGGGGGASTPSWLAGCRSCPACAAVAGYHSSIGNRRRREASTASIVRTPTGKRPRTNGSYVSMEGSATGSPRASRDHGQQDVRGALGVVVDGLLGHLDRVRLAEGRARVRIAVELREV